MIPFAHIFGIPVEETISTMGPAGGIVIGAAALIVRERLRRVRRRPRRH
jgi:hypothetical protein